MAFVRLLTTLLWAAVFVVLLLFAIKNAEPVTLQFYFDRAWQAPLVFVVLASFAAGAIFGVIACMPALVRIRREAAGLKRELSLRGGSPGEPRAPTPPTVPDVPSAP
jgi:putative membrane protein